MKVDLPCRESYALVNSKFLNLALLLFKRYFSVKNTNVDIEIHARQARQQ